MSLAAWDEYSDQSDKENDEHPFADHSLITEATKLLFLRKYSNTNLPKEDLIRIFQECNYIDNDIIKKIEKRIKEKESPYIILEKPFEHIPHKKKTSGPYNYMNNKKNYYYNSSNCKTNKYYQPYHKKKTRHGHKNEEHKIYEDLVEISDYPNELELTKKSTGLSDMSNESKSNNEEKPLNQWSTIYLGKNYIQKSNVFSSKVYPSKLFPGVFFDAPVTDPNKKCWDRVIQYYAS